MRKNFTLLFLLGIFGLFTTNLFAQQDATIDPANIRYWIGEGENQVVFIVNWAEPDTALAWGYRFADETVTIKDVMDGIAAADYRFSYDATESEFGYWLNDLFFNDGTLNLSLTEPGWVSYLVNGDPSWNYFDAQTLANGDYVKWGDTYCGTMIDPENWIYVWEKEVVAVYPLADEAKIDPSEIIYWVGEGQNEVVFAVNFADPQDRCFAWGYRFAAESVTVKEMMKAIAEVDLRFAFNDEPSSWGGYMLTGLTFDYDENHYDLQGYNAMYNLNGVQSWFTFDEQNVVNGDFVKWGDYTIGVEIAPWTYVWTQEVEPVSVYTGVNENETNILAVYPNPAVNETFVTLENSGLNEVSIYDVQGRLVRKESFVAKAGEQVRLGIEMLNAGVYFVRVSSENAMQTAKLVVR